MKKKEDRDTSELAIGGRQQQIEGNGLVKGERVQFVHGVTRVRRDQIRDGKSNGTDTTNVITNTIFTVGQLLRCRFRIDGWIRHTGVHVAMPVPGLLGVMTGLSLFGHHRCRRPAGVPMGFVR